ncbi:MAG: anaerobic ribonucleoside-triphosphate reductase activating protein [Patescibacteria group bacterium]|jgi:pyruvate formate lyase activating enzyme
MEIGGLQKFSLLDYPGKIAAIVFTQGCNFRCHYCYNPVLVWPKRRGKVKYPSPKGEGQEGHPRIKEGDLFDFLKKRKGKLDGVVVTGGEPTIQPDLPEFLAKIKKLGYLIKLDTNGSNPKMLSRIFKEKLADYIAMDLKAAPEEYEKACGIKFGLDKIKKSIKIIRESGVAREFRTTAVPGLVDKSDIEALGKLIKGEENWFLQGFKKETELVNERFRGEKAYNMKEMEGLRKIALKYVKNCGIR